MDQFIKNLARGAGQILKNGFRTKFKINEKSAFWDVVTEFDLAAEKYVIDKIKKKYPTHAFVSEESGYIGKAKNFWVIDPLDGTRAFSKGIAQFAVSIAFVSGRTVEYGVIYDPIADELFFAKRGNGAFLQNKRIKIADPGKLQFATIAMIMGTGKTPPGERMYYYENLVVKNSLWLSKLDSAALTMAYTACGRYDFSVIKYLSPWDNAAGALILREAGAKVTDSRGKVYRWESEDVVAGAPKIHREVMNIIKSYHK